MALTRMLSNSGHEVTVWSALPAEIEELEKKVAAHNSLVERMYKLEGRMNLLENKRRDSHEQD